MSPAMNALNRITRIVPEVNTAAPLVFDFSLLGVGSAIVLWAVLHVAFALSWLSAGTR